MKIFNTVMTTTALVTILVASAPQAYAMDEPPIPQNNRKLPKPPSDYEKVNVELNPTGAAKSVIKHADGKITVTTDHNNWASYQLETNQFEVTGDQSIKIFYNITVEEGGRMSLGVLNGTKSYWYPSQVRAETEELILTAGSYKGLFERRVPVDERQASLVFRNYHLGTSGQTTFTINHLNIERELVSAPATPPRTSTANPAPEENLGSVLDVITQNLPRAAAIFDEAATQPETQQQATLKAGFNALGQDLLQTPQANALFGQAVVGGWLQQLGRSAQRGDERSTNQRLYGVYEKDHDLAKRAWNDPTNVLVDKAAADAILHNDETLYNKLMSKADRFPAMSNNGSLKERLETYREQYRQTILS